MSEIFIDRKYLDDNPTHIFIFGDNTMRRGTGGAAKLRNYLYKNNINEHENAIAKGIIPSIKVYGFITKRLPSHNAFNAYYRVEDYMQTYLAEINRLKETMAKMHSEFYFSQVNSGTHPYQTKPALFLMSKIGAGLANKYGIFENIIQPTIRKLLSSEVTSGRLQFLWT